MTRASKEQLLASDPVGDADELTLPDGSTVLIRGLSRYEVMLAQKKVDQGPGAIEQFVVARGLVEPSLSEQEVAAWARSTKGGTRTAFNMIAEAIGRRSGMLADQRPDREAYEELRDNPGSEFRPPADA